MAVQKQDGLFTDIGESAEDLRGKEFLFCGRTADGKIELCGNGEAIAGVISEGRDTGKHTSFNTGAMLKVIAGGAIAIDDNVQSNALGQAVTGNTNSIGKARSVAAAAGELVEIWVDRTS